MRLNHVWVLALALALLGAGAAQGQAFCDKVKALANDPAVAAAHWGVSVTALDGTVLCSLNEAQLFRPASNNKLFTMAAALALLGPERTFTTTVVAEGELTGGVLLGNLRLVGGGDANFGSTDVPYVEPSLRPNGQVQEPATIKDIEDLADQIVARGLRTIEGDVIGDDRYFAWEPYPVGWEVDDLTAGFGAPVSALTIHDSELEIDVSPGAVKAGNEASIASFPGVGYYLFSNSSVTSARIEHPKPHLQIERAVGSREFVVGGEIPFNNPPVKVHAAIQDPAEYAALALKEALERRGVRVTGKARGLHAQMELEEANAGSAAEKEAAIRQLLTSSSPSVAFGLACAGSSSDSLSMPLAQHTSPRLADDIVYTAKESQNLHAEMMVRNLGAIWVLPCTSVPARASVGLGLVRAYLVQAGIASADFVSYDGSGLSGHDLVAPRAFTQLLVYAAKQKWFDTFKAALPVGGVDGTLASRFAAPASKLAGKVFAKTGTLGESRALSGYVTAASGKTIVFSVMVDNHPPGTAADRVAMDKMVETIAAGN